MYFAMRYFTVLLLLFAFGFTLPACAQQAGSSAKKTVKAKKSGKKALSPASSPAETVAGPVITFERTPCFGKCPAYSMQVFADGRVLYEGRRDVPMLGQKELKVSTATVADMLRRAKEAHFDQFQTRYSQNTTDLPNTIVSVRQPNGQLKTVSVEEGAPDNVRELFTYFSNHFDALAQLQADR